MGFSRKFLDSVGQGMLRGYNQQLADEKAAKARAANWNMQLELSNQADARKQAEIDARRAIAEKQAEAQKAHWAELAAQNALYHKERMKALDEANKAAANRWNIKQASEQKKAQIGALEKQLQGFFNVMANLDITDPAQADQFMKYKKLYDEAAKQLNDLGYHAIPIGEIFDEPKPVPGLPGNPEPQGFTPPTLGQNYAPIHGASGSWGQETLAANALNNPDLKKGLNIPRTTAEGDDLKYNLAAEKTLGSPDTPMIPTKPGDTVYLPQYGATYRLGDDGKTLIKVK